MGLRPFKELMPMKKSEVDLENTVVHIPDSKTPSGIGNMPMTAPARDAFKAQMDDTPGSEYLFPSPSPRAKRPYITQLRESLGKNAATGWYPVLSPVSPSAHLCYQAKCRRRCRSFRRTDASSGRFQSLQTIQPGEAQYDARGFGKAGSPTSITILLAQQAPTDRVFAQFSHS